MITSPITQDTYKFGTVTALSPLRVKIDGDSSAVGSTPVSLVANLAVNDRVWCKLRGLQLVVLGKVGGTSPPAPPNYGPTTYTVHWSDASQELSIGNGTLEGRYWLLPTDLVVVRVYWLKGSTTDTGSGAYTWSLPFANITTSRTGMGNGHFERLGVMHPVQVRWPAADEVGIQEVLDESVVGSGWGFTEGDWISFALTYQRTT